MNTRRAMSIWRFGLMLVLLSICILPQLAAAGTVPPVPTGPLDAVNGIPDYYTTPNWANSYPMAKFVDTLPGLGSGKANNLGQYLSVAKPDITTYPGSDYYEIEVVQFTEQMHSDLTNGTLLRDYRQVNLGTDLSPNTLPSEGLCGADRHACTPADTAVGVGITPDPVRYMGPTIISERDRPVRIKLTNRLPVGPLGDLFIPVDTTVMGAGTGPAYMGANRGEGEPCDNTLEGNTCASYTQNRASVHLHGGRTPWISDGTPHQWITPVEEITPFTKGVSMQNVPDMPDPGDGSMTFYYTNQQSARLMFYHDHAWGITRLNVYAGGAAGYLITDQYEQDLVNRGLVPPDQIPLIIQDKTFVDATPTTKYIYNSATGLFDTPITVPKVRETDPLWNWGRSTPDGSGVREPVTGDLWLPHVYMPAQNPLAGSGGVNPFGRWMYGPWFYPATAIEKGPVANPYYDVDCSSPFPAVYAQCSTPGQPPLIPGTPNVSMGMEAFQDSAVVNGTAFPTLTVDPRAYRFRILNAASDRFWNLSFYIADPAQTSPDPRTLSPLTEVKMVPASAELAAANNWPADWPVDGRDGGVPDPGFCQPGGVDCPNLGPGFLQIGNESGFLPQPTVRAPQPVTYIIDPTAFWVGNVDKTALALGPAERADVIVDFSAYAGKTLILYNDAPAAWPARVPGYDYYTGAPDLRDSGGYGTGGTWDPITGTWVDGTGPLVGYAPNTRTVMQVIVTGGASGLPSVDPPYAFDPVKLANEFTTAAEPTLLNPAPVKTLFERAQEPIIVGQAAYKETYPGSYFPPNYPWEGVNQINDHFLKFVTLAGQPVQMSTEPKGLHDEMGASFDPVYGRMSGNLGMQLPNPTTLNANLVLYGFSDIPTENVDNSTTVNVQVLGSDPALIPWQVTDGTQIWKISHNGVDTHPIHFHIFDVQLINRVGWDGQIALPEANELGWKEVVKVSPLEDTIVAVRPRAPALPFGVPNSLRPLNPGIPIDSGMGFNSVDWQTGQARIPAVTNKLYDFLWEYVWHCHILSHEEMDMMRPIVLNVVNNVPAAPELSLAGANVAQVDLAWTDPTPVNYASRTGFGDPSGEIGFRVERCTGAGCTDFAPIGTALANVTTYSDGTVASGASYEYQVIAYNAAGDSLASNALPVTAQNYFIITVNAGANGSISPAGPTVAVPEGGNQTFTITPSVGYHIADVLVDGGSVGAVATYDFTTVVANHSISATFAPDNFTIDASATAGGTISPSGAVSVLMGGSQSFTITPDLGYHIANVTVDGTSVGALAAYDFTNVTANHTIVAEFAINTYTLTATAGTGGTIAPAGVTVVNYNGTQAYSITADPSYLILDVLVDGVSQGAISTYTFSNVTANHTIDATFIPIAVAPATLTVPATVTANHDVPVTASASPTPGAVYFFEYSGNNGASWLPGPSGTATSVTITVPQNGTYLFRVSVTATGYAQSAYTYSSACLVNATVLDVPSLTVPASSSNGIISLSWTASPTPGVTYLLFESKDGGAYTQVDSTTATSTVLLDRTNGTYAYRIQAVLTGWTGSGMTDGSNPCVVFLVVEPVATLTVPTTSNTGNVDLTWTASATPGVTYVLYESKNGGGFSQVATTTATLQTLTGRTNGTYSYRIMATLTGWANSALTNGSNPCVVSLTVEPVASLTVPATSSTGSISISWTPSATNGVTYVLYESKNGGNYTQVATTTATSRTLTGRTNGTYSYRIKATKAGWLESPLTYGSNSCVVLLAVAAPGSLNVPPAPSSTTGTVTLTWTRSTTTGVTYKLYESKNGGAYVQVASTTGTLTTLPCHVSGTYSYQIKAIKTGWADSPLVDGNRNCVSTRLTCP